MATYKVIQDIESEDKLLGPLTLRQFIYAAMVIMMGFIAFKLAPVSILLVLPFIPPMLFFGLLAAPFGQVQSSEVWLLAKIQFFLKPRRRIWNQSGVLDLVTITAPKRIERSLTDGLTQTEVKSRLQALANTIDSRGWAVKNVNVNLYNQPNYLTVGLPASDRLVDSSVLPQDVPATDVTAADDILDEKSNPTAQHLDSMITQAGQAHHQAAVATAHGKTSHTQPQTDYWFMNQPDPSTTPPGYATFTQSQTVLPGAAPSTDTTVTAGAAEEALLEQVHKEQARPDPSHGHLRTINPKRHEQRAKSKEQKRTGHKTRDVIDPELRSLAARDDLNVDTIAREASRSKQPPNDEGEVTISLR